MKRYYKLVAGLLILISLLALAGCGNKKAASNSTSAASSTSSGSPQVNQPKMDRTITTVDDFTTSYQTWTNRLDDLAARTRKAYAPWAKGQVPVDTYLDQIGKIYEEMKKLNNETDLHTEIKLSQSEEKKAHYQEVYNAYLRASKDLNDFLVTSKTRPDDVIKAKYQELMVKQYTQDVAQLKKLLGM